MPLPVEDVLAIQKLLADYNHAIDAGDGDAFAGAFVEDGTLVTESWDISQERVKFAVRPARGKTRKGMEATLERIEQIVTA